MLASGFLAEVFLDLDYCTIYLGYLLDRCHLASYGILDEVELLL
jgi:hypothetical protein